MSTAPLDHPGNDAPGKQKRRRQIGRERAGEILERRLAEGLDEEDAGVIDQDIRYGELFVDLIQGALDVSGFRDVALDVGAALGARVFQAAREPHDMHPAGPQRDRHRETDPARGARHERDFHSAKVPPCTSLRNSSRVLPSSRNAPRSELVTVLEFCFSTPRIIMQR